MRTRSSVPSGHSCAARARCASAAAATASFARRNATKNASPCVSISCPSCATNAVRKIRWWSARAIPKRSPSCFNRRVGPSMSAKRKVIVPCGSSATGPECPTKLRGWLGSTHGGQKLVRDRGAAESQEQSALLEWLPLEPVRLDLGARYGEHLEHRARLTERSDELVPSVAVSRDALGERDELTDLVFQPQTELA